MDAHLLSAHALDQGAKPLVSVCSLHRGSIRAPALLHIAADNCVQAAITDADRVRTSCSIGNKVYADDVGVIWQQVKRGVGITWADYRKGEAELDKRCPCAAPAPVAILPAPVATTPLTTPVPSVPAPVTLAPVAPMVVDPVAQAVVDPYLAAAGITAAEPADNAVTASADAPAAAAVTAGLQQPGTALGITADWGQDTVPVAPTAGGIMGAWGNEAAAGR